MRIFITYDTSGLKMHDKRPSKIPAGYSCAGQWVSSGAVRTIDSAIAYMLTDITQYDQQTIYEIQADVVGESQKDTPYVVIPVGYQITAPTGGRVTRVEASQEQWNKQQQGERSRFEHKLAEPNSKEQQEQPGELEENDTSVRFSLLELD